MSPRGAGSHSRPRRWSSRLVKQGPESPEPTAIPSPSTASSDPSLSVKSSLKVTKRGRGRPKKSLRVSWAETVRVRRISEFDKEYAKESVELPLQESIAVAGDRRAKDAPSLPNKKKDREPGTPDEQPSANNSLVAQSKSLGVLCKTASIQGNFSEEEDEGESLPVTQKEEKWWIAESNIMDPTGNNPNLDDVKEEANPLSIVSTTAKRGRGRTTVQPRRARKTENPAAKQQRKGPGRAKITSRVQGRGPQNAAPPQMASSVDRSSLDSFEAYKYPVKWYWNMTKLIQHDNLTLKKSVARKASNHLRQVTSNANPSARKEERCWNLDARGRSADYTLLKIPAKIKYNKTKAKDILPRGTTYYDPFEYIPDLKDSYATIVELWNDENLYAKSRNASNLGTPALGTIGSPDWQEPANMENCYNSRGYPGYQLPETPCQSAMGDVADIYRSANIALFDELV